MQRWERSSLAAAAGAHHILRGGACAARQRAFINNRRKITIKISRFPRADDALSCRLTKTGMERRKKHTYAHKTQKKTTTGTTTTTSRGSFFSGSWKATLESDVTAVFTLVLASRCFTAGCLCAVYEENLSGALSKTFSTCTSVPCRERTLFLRPAIKTRVVVVVVVVVVVAA